MLYFLEGAESLVITNMHRNLSLVMLFVVAQSGCDWAAADGPWNDVEEPTPEPPRLTVTGTVVTPDGARPVHGAHLVLSDDAGAEVATATSDAAGRFTWSDVPAGAWALEVTSGHFGLTTAVEVAAAGDLGDLRLSSTRPIVLDVRDADAASFDPVDERLAALGLASVRVGPTSAGEAAALFSTPQGLFEYGVVLIGGDLDWGPLVGDAAAMDGLADYVASGGGLYLSGGAWPVFLALVPDGGEVAGPSATFGWVRADVREEALEEGLLWDSVGVPIVEGDPVLVSAGAGVEVLLRGEVETNDGGSVDGPLAVRLALGDGEIVYVSFRAAEPRADEWWQANPAPWSLPDGSWDGRGAAIDRLLLAL